jgi:hypothetical protein
VPGIQLMMVANNTPYLCGEGEGGMSDIGGEHCC